MDVGEWTSSSRRIVREVNQGFFLKDDKAGPWRHRMPSGPTRRIRAGSTAYRGISDGTGLYDKVWWFAAIALDFLEKRKVGG